jgi:hypothetical protein
MATMVERVSRDIADAMKRKDATTLAPLRMLKAALMNREVEAGRRWPTTRPSRSCDESQISEGFQLALRWYARVCDARGAAQASLGEAIPPALASADRPADARLLRELNRTENNP